MHEDDVIESNSMENQYRPYESDKRDCDGDIISLCRK